VEVDAGLDEVRVQAAFRQLQSSPGPGDGVVVADRALLDDTENLAPGFGAIRHEGTPLLLRRDRKGLVVFADIVLAQPTIPSMPTSRNSLGRRSCKVRKARSERPLAWGE
jgi:hypothetical protein